VKRNHGECLARLAIALFCCGSAAGAAEPASRQGVGRSELAAQPPSRGVDAPDSVGRPPSRYDADAPELARLGAYAVGVRSMHFRESGQPDVLAYDAARGSAPLGDRNLEVEIWYPAKPARGAKAERYQGSLPSEPPAPPAHFTIPGLAVRDAPASGGRYPLIVFSHGMSNDVAAFSWLTENLASKGYVVAAIRHGDPAIVDRAKFPETVFRRPLDVAFVARSLEEQLGAERLVDPERVGLVGYSMGGYGVLAAGGGLLDPKGGAVQLVPGGLLLPYAAGGARQKELDVPGLRAVVAMSPFGGGQGVFGREGLAAIRVPLMLIAGDGDRRVGYTAGARAFFDQAVNARRYLLTFKGAGHSIGMSPAPESMRRNLWDEDWFEDPVWRAERVNAINAHFITAFLDRYVKGDETRAGYLDVPVSAADEGVWPDPPQPETPAPYGAYSPGGPGITLWKGFQRSQARGLELLAAKPAAEAGS
jgi:predicted dienelactone hydrolase